MIGQGQFSVGGGITKEYFRSVIDFQEKCRGLRLGYVPGVIRHYFHGSKINRGYITRWAILVKHKYNPYKHLCYTKEGLLVPSKDCPKELLDDIKNYFVSRNEDET